MVLQILSVLIKHLIRILTFFYFTESRFPALFIFKGDKPGLPLDSPFHQTKIVKCKYITAGAIGGAFTSVNISVFCFVRLFNA